MLIPYIHQYTLIIFTNKWFQLKSANIFIRSSYQFFSSRTLMPMLKLLGLKYHLLQQSVIKWRLFSICQRGEVLVVLVLWQLKSVNSCPAIFPKNAQYFLLQTSVCNRKLRESEKCPPFAPAFLLWAGVYSYFKWVFG